MRAAEWKSIEHGIHAGRDLELSLFGEANISDPNYKRALADKIQIREGGRYVLSAVAAATNACRLRENAATFWRIFRETDRARDISPTKPMRVLPSLHSAERCIFHRDFPLRKGVC